MSTKVGACHRTVQSNVELHPCAEPLYTYYRHNSSTHTRREKHCVNTSNAQHHFQLSLMPPILVRSLLSRSLSRMLQLKPKRRPRKSLQNMAHMPSNSSKQACWPRRHFVAFYDSRLVLVLAHHQRSHLRCCSFCRSLHACCHDARELEETRLHAHVPSNRILEIHSFAAKCA